MYDLAKKVLSVLVSKRFRFRYEEKFRWFYAVFHKGTRHQCTVCLKKLSRFVVLKNGEQMCPFCGSLSRHRRLWQLVNGVIKTNDAVLHFSPARCLMRRFKNHAAITYLSTDFEGEFPADHNFDITSIQLKDNSVDIVICYHVLEHIENDILAVKELNRVLKPKGVAMIQTPFKEGAIYEDPSITGPEERATHFGQKDHVRIYSTQGLKDRLAAANFNAQEHQYKKEIYYGLSAETVITAIKNI